ncbi:MAG: serine/threonine protein kinase [Proteobacteria bacterium]|nr:serine/threonine protein kinase [Pseudomonadota bacterium]
MNNEASTQPAPDDGLRLQAMRLFEQALDRPSGERRAFIESGTRDNAALARTVLALLDAHAASDGFLEPLPATTREIGAYRLIEPVGSGGMGRVWLAERRDGAYQQRVAIKVLASLIGDADSLRRAEAERQFLAWLDHPNIARVLDGGTTPEGQPYVVMEYVEGARIDAWCHERQLDPTARVRLFLQVLDALDAAHRALIIHRDIKPANVFVTADGNVKLLDFGIAKTLDDRIGGMTGTGMAPMTPEYASPEQLAGQPLTTASDIYALGLLLYELLCGASARPHGSTTGSDRARQAALQLPTRPSQCIDSGALQLADAKAREWRRRIAGDLDRIVLMALAPEPARRYESAHAFAEDLRAWLDRRPVRARLGGGGYRFGKFVRRNLLASTAATAALVALAIGLAVAAVQAQRAAAAGERAMRANHFLIGMIANADPYYGGKPPLLVDALDRAVATIPRELAGQPLLEADIRHAIGRAYLTLERNEAAKVQIERAVALRASEGGTDYARALDAQALLEWQIGHYEYAERLLRQALIQCGEDARGRQQRADILNDLSVLRNTLGAYADALALAREAQEIKRALPDTLPREQALGFANIASALDGLKRYAEAFAAYQQALHIEESMSPQPEMDISITLNNIAYLQNEMGQAEAALASLERSLALRRKVMGADYPRLVVPLSNLALQYAQAGRHDEAAATMREALRLAPQAYSSNDQMLGHLYAAAASIALARGDKPEARAQAQHALHVYDGAEAVEPGRRDKALKILHQATPAQASAAATSK